MCKSVSGPIFGLCSEHLSVIFRSIGFIRSQTGRNSFTSTKAEANLDVTRSIFVRSRQRSTTCPLSLPFGRGSRVESKWSRVEKLFKIIFKLFLNFVNSKVHRLVFTRASGACFIFCYNSEKKNLTVKIERAIF